VAITSRARAQGADLDRFAPDADGLECVVVVEDRPAAVFRFRDAPRHDSASFVGHLGPRHGFDRILLASGDRESEVRYLANLMGITDVFFGQSPEQKVAIVTAEQARQPTLFVGDGINDAPAMVAADVAIALGQRADIAAHSAGAVILDDALARVDELMHIARRTRRIALQSAGGGMALSIVGMVLAAAGLLPPLGGVIAQEAIDVWAVLNALRAAWLPRELTDFSSGPTGPSGPTGA
jgi:P-type E1-E2 ATPase